MPLRQPLDKQAVEYDLARIRVQYFEKGRDVPTAIPLPRTVVRVGSSELVSRTAKMAIGIGVAIAAGAIALLLLIRSKQTSRERKLDESKQFEHAREDSSARLSSLRSLRIEGDIGSYLERLCTLAESDTLRPHTEKIIELQQLAESVKFGGHTPSPDELNWAENIVKSAIRKAFPKESELEVED